MSTPRTLCAIAAGTAVSLLAVTACSNDRAGSNLTPSSVVTTTTLVATTTTTTSTTIPVTVAPTTSTTTTAPTTTIAEPTTTTELPGATLPLRFDGVGDVRFGTEPDGVITYISGVLGAPTADSGWVGATAIGCDGKLARQVFWNDLRLTFGDTSNVSAGRDHFFAWRYGPPGGTRIDPAGMATLLGLTVGSSIDDVQTSYPAAHIIAGDADTTPSAQLTDGLSAILSATGAQGIVTALLGGDNCTD